jgi:2,5-diamino-6-(ribosylamino)-4(3H)-pyrimidinone 5'-phosphate reductase
MKTTLFMLMSLDGKISTGASDERDFDKDLPTIPGAAEGLAQYYQLEEQTDLCSFNTGKVLAKIGWNEPKEQIEDISVTFVILDNQPHLTTLGIENLLKRCKSIIVATTSPSHPAISIKNDKLDVIQFVEQIDFIQLFKKLEQEHGFTQITIQSGGDMNAVLLRAGLINELSIVVAPVLVGGKDTQSLIGGESLQSVEDLQKIKALELLEVNKLESNYLHVRYKVS